MWQNDNEQSIMGHHHTPDFHRSNSDHDDQESANDGRNIPQRYVTKFYYLLIKKFLKKK